ncbi:hypothetical protein [Erwinia sp. V71]|uniref:hypothetical protein n=1 Tax=Erwinia sp. V71 TaxID=3369424 RepID=UPI003F5E1EB2
MSILHGKIVAIASRNTKPMAATNQLDIGQPRRWSVRGAIGTPAANAFVTTEARRSSPQG